MQARTIMFQGTGSDVGKSLIVAGLARALTNRGHRVKPFKPQNMSNNAAVTIDGFEIGRAQALQARAAKTAPITDMNPVLLKPQGAMGSQIVVQGMVTGTAKAAEMQALKPTLMAPVLESFSRLKSEADFVLVEGAGSASEINLRANDIANMGFARAADVPVVLIGDIDRGGVIASMVGTKAVIDPQDEALICGFLINRFRGDPSLFDDGITLIADKTGWKSFGLVPHFIDAQRLPAEDAFRLETREQTNCGAKIKIAVPVLPHISNFDDLDPLEAEAQIELAKIWPGTALPGDADLIILCGSKSTINDLAALRAAGFDTDIKAHIRRGGHLLGICGGFQMLGHSLSDPEGIEGEAGTVAGLGYMNIETVLRGEKRLENVAGQSFDGTPLSGYEMHVGEMTGSDLSQPFATLEQGRSEGVVLSSGRIFGTHLHGLFNNDAQRASWLKRLGGSSTDLRFEDQIEDVLDGLASHLETHLDVEAIIAHAR